MTEFAFSDRQRTTLVSRRWWLIALIGAAIGLVGFWAAGWPDPVTAADLEQTRFNRALPAPQAAETFFQTFSPGHDGLSRIDLILVQYRPDDPDPAATALLQLRDSRGRLVAEQRLKNTAVSPNQKSQLIFPPESHSRGERYTLSLSGSAGNGISLWGYSLDVLPEGELSGSGTAGLAELQFSTRYTLLWSGVLPALGEQIARLGLMLAAALLLIPLPGSTLIALFRPRWPRPVRWGAAWALGVALWPLLWLWWGVPGGRWAGWGLWLVVLGGWSFVVWRTRRGRTGPISGETAVESWLMIAFLFFILAVRLLAVRDAAALPWVDAERHALITAVMAGSGRLVADYEPFLPVDRSPYHTGAHTLSAGLRLMLGRYAPLETLLLGLMQLLSALTSLTLYAGGWLLTRRRSAGWLAAFLAGLPFFFPAYYTTWGRLTQLAGVLILPVLLALTWRLAQQAPRLAAGSSRWRLTRPVIFISILAAGLFLVHARVFVFYLPFALLVGAGSWAAQLRRNGWRSLPLPWLQIGLLVPLLALPRLWTLYADQPGFYQPVLQPFDDSYNAFPAGYVTTGWETPFWIAATVGLVIILLAWQLDPGRARLVRPPLALALWIGLLFLLVGGETLAPGWPILLPEVNLNSMYIALFAPQALFLGSLAVYGLEVLARRGWLANGIGLAAAGGWLAVALVFGVREQIDILNESTLLIRPADLPALYWLAAHTPPEAKIAHGGWHWLFSTWAGTDGGGWIVPLTGRRSTTPPIDHVYNPALREETIAFNTTAAAIADWSTPAAAAFLRDQGVTAVFVGARGGYFDPAELLANPELRLVYRDGPVFIFELAPPTIDN